MLETFARILQACSHLCHKSQSLHWPSNSEPLQSSVTIQPLLPVWVQTSLNIAPSHILFFLLSPFHCYGLKLQIGGQLMPSIPLSWPFLNPPPFFHIHCKSWQFCLLNIDITCIRECFSIFSISKSLQFYFCLQTPTYPSQSSEFPITACKLFLPLLSTKKEKFLWGSYHLAIPSLSPWSLGLPLPLTHRTHMSLNIPHNVHNFWWPQYLSKWA